MATLVTGAAGRLGGAVARSLSEKGMRVIATDMHDLKIEKGGGTTGLLVDGDFHRVDLRDMKEVQGLPWEDIERVVHVAAFPGPSREVSPGVILERAKDPKIGLETVSQSELLIGNVASAWNIMECAARAGTKRLVFSSSAFSYGYSHDPVAFVPKYLPIDENHPQLPYETYGLSKVIGELSASLLARASSSPTPPTSYVSLEFTNIIKKEAFDSLPWPDPSPEPRESRKIGQNGEKLLNFGPEYLPTLLMWGYTHEDDVVDAHILALDAELPAEDKGHSRIIISANTTRYATPTQRLLSRHFPQEIFEKIILRPGAMAECENFSVLDNKKAKQVLGWNPRCWQNDENNLENSEKFPKVLENSERFPTILTCEPTEEGTYDFPLVATKLEFGEYLENAWVRYAIHGEMNKEKSNIILLLTSFDATHRDVTYHIRPGGTLDPTKFCVIVINHLGNGESYSPSHSPPWSSHPRYPRCVSPFDQARVISLLLDSLGIEKVQLAYGYSMGAIHSLHLAASDPERIRRVAGICGGVRACPTNKVFLESLRHCIFASEGWDDKSYWFSPSSHKSLSAMRKAFARIYAGWGVSSEFYETAEYEKIGYESLEDFSIQSYEAGFQTGDMNNLLAQIDTWRSADLSRGFEGSLADALGSMRCPVLLMPCTTDKYFLAEEIKDVCQSLSHGIYRPINSSWGHRAGDPWRETQEHQANLIRESVNDFLQVDSKV